MILKKVFKELNVFSQCKKYGLPLWQCPQFLFLAMGIIIISSTLLAYGVGTRYIDDPLMVAFGILLLTATLIIMAFFIIQSFERLAEASRMKTEFISIVSHQLRAPLSNLKWAIEFLMSGRLGKIEEKQTEYFRILKENSGRMEELISGLLTVSRIESATLNLKKEIVSLEKIAESLILEFKPFARASNVGVKFSSQENLPEIFIDPSRIKLVLENLLDNAIRYSQEKGIIEMSLERKEGNLYFEIKDNGVGIPKEDQKYIFQKFFRSENALKYQTQGSGLGLYIAKAIVEKSGGKIGFKSKENKGTTFWLTLPVQ
ncbi:sensor histidine kinase [Patescibacteria group bacterium]